ncbi:MAG: hypothetical protein ABI624_10090, partial [Casimicrobiaceae bacterium]
MTKAERDAQKLAKRIDEAVAGAANVAAIALTAMAGAALSAFAAIDQLAKQAAHFKDLEETIGANAEVIASFSVAAQVAGVNIDSVAEASVKLTRNLTGVDDESKAAGAALAALNIPIEEFKKLDPASQLETVAKALAGFGDGADKTAVAVALLGKSGAQMLPFLKELATGSGRVVILNQQLIEQADTYADKQAKARAELNLYAQVAASQALPAITNLTGATKDLISELLGVDTQGKKLRDSHAIIDFANDAVQALGYIVSAGQGLAAVFQVVGQTIAAGVIQTAAVARGDLAAAVAVGRDWQRQIDGILQKQLFSQQLSARIKSQQDSDARRAVEDRGFTPPGKVLKFAGVVKDTSGLKERTSDAERYIESLQRQIDKTLELTTVEEANIALAKFKTPATEAQRANILALAAEVDAYKELEKWIISSGKAHDEEARAAKQAADVQAKITASAFDYADKIKQGNNALRDEIAIILGGEPARKALEKDYTAAAIAEKEFALASLEVTDATESQRKALESSITLLKEHSELLDGKDIAEGMRKAADAAKALAASFNEIGSSSFSQLLQDLAGGKGLISSLKSFEATLQSKITSLVADNLSKQAFGDSGIFVDFGKTLGGIFGGAGKDAAGAAGSLALNTAGLELTTAATLQTTAATLQTTAATLLT